MDLGFINNPSINLSPDRKEDLVFVHFINSTVHTSRVIWALKTVKKLIYTVCLYWWEATQLRGAITPPSGRERRCPCTGMTPASQSCTWATSLTFKHQPAIQGAEDRPIQAILHNFCVQRSTDAHQYRWILFRNREDIWHCAQNYSHK